MQQHFHVAELWRAGYRPLYNEVGERPLLILVSSGITNIWEKQAYLKKRFGCECVWLSRQLQGMRNLKAEGILAGCFQTVTKLWTLRRNRDNVAIVMTHAAVSHTGPGTFKKTVPGSRVISYIYDFLNIFVPPENVEIWKEYHGGQSEQAKREYEHLNLMLAGGSSDTIIYKDYGPDWPYMKEHCKVPHFWIPQTLPEKAYQPLPDPEVGNTFCYIGTIVPKRTHARPSRIFDDIMMEQIFREVSDQGFLIHAYVLNPDIDVVNEYHQLFPEGRVRLFPGTVLEMLLPRLARRYRWGWMLYHFPQPMVLPFVGISLPTKFYTYLALGLPIVVSAEMEAVCRMVRKYHCGVVVTQDEILHLRDVLKDQDYEALQKGVLAARAELSLDKHYSTLGAAVENTFKRDPIIMEPFDDEASQQVQRPEAESAYRRPTALVPRREEGLRAPFLRETPGPVGR